jgi:hypothetical protein
MALIQPVVQPNIAELIMQGLGAARQFQDVRRQEKRGAREDELFDLSQQIAANPQDAEAIRRRDMLDPAGAAARRKAQFEGQQQLAAERTEFDKGEAFQASEIVNQPLDRQISSLQQYAVRLGQDKRPMAAEELSSTQQLIGVLESGDPQQIAQAQEIIGQKVQSGIMKGYLKAPKGEGGELAIVRKIKALRDPNLSEEEKGYIKADLAGQGMVVETTPDGGTIIRAGKGLGKDDGVLTKKSRNTLENAIISGERSTGRLNRIYKQFDKDFLTFQGKGKAWWTALKSKADVDLTAEERGFVDKKRRFTQNVNRFFNAYRKDITGAAASVQELESLKKAVFNEDLSPVEFKAALDEFRDETLRAQRINRRLLREGVTGDLRNKKSDAARRMDEYFLLGEDDQPLQRMADLQRAGKSEEEIFKLMNAEGYKF